MRPTERIERAFEGIRTDRTIADLRAERDALREALEEAVELISWNLKSMGIPWATIRNATPESTLGKARAALQRRSAT